ncbi:DUF1206 domain-containing protein [Leptolyngbya sp. FACHB-711]|uniref:DUF1206 domain-containing protein n=1 Tax=unclassified Leptolyngbya TaxID=2650499 RepID=UPI001687EC21|nr:DUF1206 domain-containing protein [Leptolyngbya sp. FACHB-711]MBD1850061.1 DUF1206 domain-containing protein [Cyanobacteria bacterium FACHB-502]MBD2024781.1 DUF1206 domain-containing protein [Leptolyngbya sp. FACHB-711]
MARHNSPLSNLEQPARRAASHPWIEKLARLGFAAKGIVYFVVGLLAAQAAFGTGGKTTDSSGALSTIVTQPFGKFLLALVTIGLIGYALWRLVQTIFDPEHAGEPTKAKQIAQRIGYGLSALTYSGLALTAIKLIMGNPTSGGDSTQDWTARFMAQPFGRWLVGLAGLVVIGVGLAYLYEAFIAKFQRHFNLNLMSESERQWTKRLGQFGIAARGIVFGIIGLFLTLAALRQNANEARGLGGALAALAAQPFGPWLLGIVALGFIAYSIYSLIEARYRQIRHP